MLLAQETLVRLTLTSVLLAFVGSKCDAQVLSVRNDTDGIVTFWLRSETHPPKEWNKWTIGREKTKRIDLVSPDRFKLAITNRASDSFVSDYVPLRAMLREDPSMIISLREFFETEVYSVRTWDPRLCEFRNKAMNRIVGRFDAEIVLSDGTSKSVEPE